MYEGFYVGDQRHGEGKITFPDGSVQVGEYRYDRYITRCDEEGGGEKEGNAYNSVIHTSTTSTEKSENEVILLDGSIYVGDLQDGAPHGRGKLLHTNGFVSSGEFILGALHNGTRYKFMPSKDMYEEKYVDGVKEQATLTLFNGDVLIGDWLHTEKVCAEEKADCNDV